MPAIRIDEVVVFPSIEEKLWVKHHLTKEEALEVCFSEEAPVLVERSHDKSYILHGQTDAGRYIIVVLYPQGSGVFHLGTARDMDNVEKNKFRQFRGKR